MLCAGTTRLGVRLNTNQSDGMCHGMRVCMVVCCVLPFAKYIFACRLRANHVGMRTAPPQGLHMHHKRLQMVHASSFQRQWVEAAIYSM